MSGVTTQPWMAFIDLIAGSNLAYGGVLALHIFSMAALIGSALALDLRLLRISHIATIEEMAGHIRPIWLVSIAIAILTGLLLFLIDPAAFTGNGWFIAKIALLGGIVLNAMVHARITVLSSWTQWRAGFVSAVLWPALTLAAVMSGQDDRPGTDIITDTELPVLIGELDQKWIARP
ncbi:hypothetical protein AAD018_013555 [Aestuariibius insulae]|uniref:hypothetical protein n=1 Tax=Aestuariibius insulae TaxID=2058287 RepID=UPI00345ED5D1